MEKIDTDYKQRISKISAKFFKPFNRDAAPLSVTVPLSPRTQVNKWVEFNAGGNPAMD